MSKARFEAAYPFDHDVLALPVGDLDEACSWYANAFGLKEIERRADPPSVLMERDGVRIGFAINPKLDPANEGAAIKVNDAAAAREELEANGVKTGNWRVDERDGKKLQVFFVVAPDQLCYYFHQPIEP